MGTNESMLKEDFLKAMRALRPQILTVLVLLSAVLPAAADASSARQQKEQAIAALEKDIQANPNNAELWIHLGFAYRKLEMLDKSQEAFEKASSLDANNSDALYMLGLIYEKKKQNTDALRVWKQYLSVVTDPEKRSVADNHIHHLSQ